MAMKQDDLDTGDRKVDKAQELIVGEQGNKGSTEHAYTSEYVYDGPPFSIGLTQLESSECANETKQMEERNLEHGCDAKESCDIRGEQEGNVMENVEANWDKVIKTMKEKRRNPIREIGLAIASKSSYKIRGVDITEAIIKDEELIWEYLFKEEGMTYKLYGKKKRMLEEEVNILIGC
ncbi:hypothetical protein L1987_87053 [Smallanthus sonchifolius]|nr:hypothetical protein L1987_87053 [Smallanthus sonchifolius]